MKLDNYRVWVGEKAQMGAESSLGKGSCAHYRIPRTTNKVDSATV